MTNQLVLFMFPVLCFNLERGLLVWHWINILKMYLQLHAKSGMPPHATLEIHGSLRYLQCSRPCNDDLIEVDANFLGRLEAEEDWVPRCAQCDWCLRPNVMVFGDDCFVDARLEAQQEARADFAARTPRVGARKNWVVLEIGAGTVVPSIRLEAEVSGSAGMAMVRVNPSEGECLEFELGRPPDGDYFPLAVAAREALEALVAAL